MKFVKIVMAEPFVFGKPLNKSILQTVKTQIKCSIMLHFISLTVCKSKKDLQIKEYNIFLENYNLTPQDMYSLLYQTSRKTPFVYKGLMFINFR